MGGILEVPGRHGSDGGRYRVAMTPDPIRLTLADLPDDPDALDELERALLKARATELTEVRRRNVRLTAGYGDATSREVMGDEGRRAQLRHDGLTALLEALREARGRA